VKTLHGTFHTELERGELTFGVAVEYKAQTGMAVEITKVVATTVNGFPLDDEDSPDDPPEEMTISGTEQEYLADLIANKTAPYFI